ncbi:hypothetical protein YTPLAS18_05430 [Nitrospira sp.]|nr:hypothetical protein YTPLAS18_05430 [Nitrospira sp.]
MFHTLFNFMLMKAAVDIFAAHQEAFNEAIKQQERLLKQLSKGSGSISARQRNQFSNAFSRAQSELNQLDALRRQQSEMRLADMRGQAASVGLFLD